MPAKTPLSELADDQPDYMTAASATAVAYQNPTLSPVQKASGPLHGSEGFLEIDLEAGLSGEEKKKQTSKQFYWYDHEVALRNGFLRKVYGILLAQIMLTTGIVVLCMFEGALQQWLLQHLRAVYWSSFLVSLALIFLLFKVQHSHPANLLVLFAFTISESFFLGLVCALYKEQNMGPAVLYAFIATCTVFVLLSVLTLQSKWDVTGCGSVLFVGLNLMILWGIVNILMGFRLTFLYGLLGSLLFCGFIIYDTKMIQERYGYDDYVVAAIELYLDFVNLFVHILAALGSDR